jgi:hypothetical protein
MISDMKSCKQTKGQSVLDHGISVKKYTFDLLNHLRFNLPLKYDWKLPEWLYENKELILSSLPSDKDLKYYTILHDCGKPYCLTIDDKGRHFPDHANVSSKIYSQIFNNDTVSSLIKHDMDIHLLKSVDVDQFCENPFAITHLIVGLAEIHSNAQMFGGFDSTSFKIKWKSINQRGKQIIKSITKK